MALDLGGVAKGHALDEAANVLQEHGVNCALIHGGTSSVVAIGNPPGELARGRQHKGLAGRTLGINAVQDG